MQARFSPHVSFSRVEYWSGRFVFEDVTGRRWPRVKRIVLILVGLGAVGAAGLAFALLSVAPGRNSPWIQAVGLAEQVRDWPQRGPHLGSSPSSREGSGLSPSPLKRVAILAGPGPLELGGRHNLTGGGAAGPSSRLPGHRGGSRALRSANHDAFVDAPADAGTQRVGSARSLWGPPSDRPPPRYQNVSPPPPIPTAGPPLPMPTAIPPIGQ